MEVDGLGLSAPEPKNSASFNQRDPAMILFKASIFVGRLNF